MPCSATNSLRIIRVGYRRVTRRRPLQRLASSIAAYQLQVSKRQPVGLVAGSPVAVALNQAQTAVDQGKLDEGWKFFLLAQRLSFVSMTPPELQAEAVTIRGEAEKLNGWRKAAVISLLDSAAPTCADELFKAAELRDEHYHNEAYKDGLRRSNALALAVSLVAIIVAFLVLIGQPGFDSLGLANAWRLYPLDFAFVALVVIVGLLGANVSAITDFGRGAAPARIPELIATWRVTVLRLFLGAGAAVATLFFLAADIVIHATNAYQVLAFAFAAGFTERLVPRVVASFTPAGEK